MSEKTGKPNGSSPILSAQTLTIGSPLPGIVMRCCALCSFAMAVISGMAADNPATTILVRALLMMFAAMPIGWMIGWVASRVAQTETARKQLAISAPDGASSASTSESSKEALTA